MKWKNTLAISSLLLASSTQLMAETLLGYIPDLAQAEMKLMPSTDLDCGLLAGNKFGEGVLLAGGDNNRTIQYYAYSMVDWPVPKRDPQMPVSFITGSTLFGPIIAGGDNQRQVQYMNSYAANIWHVLPDAPFTIKGLAGINPSGPVVHNGHLIAYLSDYAAPYWSLLETPPFSDAEIVGMAGDQPHGIVVYSDDNQIAWLASIDAPNWIYLVPPIDDKIIDITGDGQTGVVIQFENGQIWYHAQHNNRWVLLETSEFYHFSHLVGNPEKGIAFCLDFVRAGF